MMGQLVFEVTEVSQVAEVRRQAIAPASTLGFSDTDVGKVAIIVTEVTTNVIKHAVQGEVFIRWLETQGKSGFEILALDKGPGMTNVAVSQRDGYSTSGSPGTGMGAMRRLASRFDLHSLPAKGTAVMAQVWSSCDAELKATNSLDIGVVCRAKHNEIACGDGWETASFEGRQLLLVVDGLGHGVGAATAAQAAIRIFRSNIHQSPAIIVELAHAALRPTRGAVLAVAEIDSSQHLRRYHLEWKRPSPHVPQWHRRSRCPEDTGIVLRLSVERTAGIALGWTDVALESGQLSRVEAEGTKPHCRGLISRLPTGQ